MATRELATVLNSGDITSIYLDGVTPNDKVIKKEDLSIIENNLVTIGFADYNDLATATTPISISSGVFTPLTNDGLGSYTSTAYLPSGVTSVWNTTTNQFVWNELSLGDMVDIRVDVEITTTTPSQTVELVLELATGGFNYDIPFTYGVFKSAGTYQLNRFNGIYIGDANTRDNGGMFKLKSDAAATVKVNGWYCKVIKKV